MQQKNEIIKDDSYYQSQIEELENRFNEDLFCQKAFSFIKENEGMSLKERYSKMDDLALAEILKNDPFVQELAQEDLTSLDSLKSYDLLKKKVLDDSLMKEKIDAAKAFSNSKKITNPMLFNMLKEKNSFGSKVKSTFTEGKSLKNPLLSAMLKEKNIKEAL